MLVVNVKQTMGFTKVIHLNPLYHHSFSRAAVGSVQPQNQSVPSMKKSTQPRALHQSNTEAMQSDEGKIRGTWVTRVNRTQLPTMV